MSLRKLSQLLQFALFACVLALLFFANQPFLTMRSLWPDEALYAWSSGSIARYPLSMFSAYVWESHPPLFSSVLALLTGLQGAGEAQMRLAVLCFGLLSVALMYVLASLLKNRFAGALAAIFLALNPTFYFYLTRVLIDIPQTTFFLALMVSLVLARRHLFLYGISAVLAACIIWLKLTGVFVLAVLAASWLYARSRRLGMERGLMFVIGVGVIALAVLLGRNLLVAHSLLPNLKAFMVGDIFIRPFWFYLAHMGHIFDLPIVGYSFIYGLVVLGIQSLRRSRPGIVLVLSWFLVYGAFISMSREKEFRYALMIIPALVLIAALGLNRMMVFCLRGRRQLIYAGQIMVLVLLGLYGAFVLKDRVQAVSYKSSTYTGFDEAGVWLKRNVSRQDAIFAHSMRALRFYSGFDLAGPGNGNVRLLPDVPARIIGQGRAGTKAYLVLDRWEYTQPAWAYPLTRRKVDALIALEFKVEHHTQDWAVVILSYSF